MKTLILKDISKFEPYEDWWDYCVSVKKLIINDSELNPYYYGSIAYVLKLVLTQLNIPYESSAGCMESDYENYLISILEDNKFRVIFEAHDDLIEYETKGVVSAFNPGFKIQSDYNNFIFAEDSSNTHISYIFKDIPAHDIINYHSFSKSVKHFISDKVLNNVINTYKGDLSFYEFLYKGL